MSPQLGWKVYSFRILTEGNQMETYSTCSAASWRRLGKACALYAVLDYRRLTDEVLKTTFCLVEQTLKNHPLRHASSDANNFYALTPNLFLGSRNSCMPSLASVDAFDHRKRYARAQAYTNEIWKRWLTEYVLSLKMLQMENSTSPSAENLVWIVDDDSPKGHYPIARVSSLRYGKDGFARSIPPRGYYNAGLRIFTFGAGGCCQCKFVRARGNNMCIRTDCSWAYMAERLIPKAGAPEVAGSNPVKVRTFRPHKNLCMVF